MYPVLWLIAAVACTCVAAQSCALKLASCSIRLNYVQWTPINEGTFGTREVP